MNIIIYNHSEEQGITAFLSQGEIVYTLYNYNGVGLTMPTGEIRIAADVHATHFATTIAGRLYICKITGIKAINASVITYSYEIDYLKDYAAQTNGIGRIFCKSPIKREWNGTDLSRWARWIDDPLYQSYGGTSTEYYYYGSCNTFARHFAIVVSNGLPRGSSSNYARGFYPLSVYIVSYGYMDKIINYLLFGTYASTLYKQIIACYAIPNIVDFDVSTAFANYTSSDLCFAVSGDWEFIDSDDSGTCWLIDYRTGHGSEYTWFTSKFEMSVDLSDFRDIYRTHYYWQVAGFPPFKVPVEIDMAVAANQTSTYEFDASLHININPVDGYFSIGIGDAKLPLNNIKCALPTVSLPSGDVAFTINNVRGNQLASTAFAAGTSAVLNYASGNYAGVVANGAQMANALFTNSMQNELTAAAGNSFSNASGYDIQSYGFSKLVAVKQLFREDYSVFAANRGYIPRGPIVDYGESIPSDAYTLLSGKSILYDTEAMEFWATDSVAANVDYYNALISAMSGTVIHFNNVYVPTV